MNKCKICGNEIPFTGLTLYVSVLGNATMWVCCCCSTVNTIADTFGYPNICWQGEWYYKIDDDDNPFFDVTKN